jgi:hypothetical protein
LAEKQYLGIILGNENILVSWLPAIFAQVHYIFAGCGSGGPTTGIGWCNRLSGLLPSILPPLKADWPHKATLWLSKPWPRLLLGGGYQLRDWQD